MKDCIFCKIVAGEIPTQFVYEDDQVVAFNDIQPAAPVHIILIPRIHIPSFDDIKPEHKVSWGICLGGRRAARKKNISEKGYRLVMNWPDGGQEVFHLHFHLLGGKPLASGYGRQ